MAKKNNTSSEHMEKMRRERIIQWKFWWRPPKYKTSKDLEKIIIEYFETFNSEENIIKLFNRYWEECWWDYRKLPTVTGLSIFLWFNSRQALINYENKDKKFYDTIKRAKLFIENFTEERLMMWKWNMTWLIFNLKNNFGWIDKVETQNETNIKWDLTIKLPE